MASAELILLLGNIKVSCYTIMFAIISTGISLQHFIILEESVKPNVSALTYITRDIIETASEFLRWDIDSGDIKQFSASLRVLQELPTGSPRVGHNTDDRRQLLNNIDSWIKGSVFQLVAYLIHRIYIKEMEPTDASVFLNGLNVDLGSLEEAYRHSCRMGSRLSWFMIETKQIISGIPYREQQTAYVLLTLYRLSKGGSLDHIKKCQDSLDFEKFVTDVLKQIEIEAVVWDKMLGSETKKLANQLQEKYNEIVENIKQEVSQLPLSNGKVITVKKAIVRGSQIIVSST